MARAGRGEGERKRRASSPKARSRDSATGRLVSPYTPELHAAFVAAVTVGATYRDACEAAGLAWATWKLWRARVEDRGENPGRGIVALVRAARVARGRATQSLVNAVNTAAATDYRAALGLLEYRATAERRRFDASRAHWEAVLAKRRAQEASGPLGADVVYVPAVLATPRAEPT